MEKQTGPDNQSLSKLLEVLTAVNGGNYTQRIDLSEISPEHEEIAFEINKLSDTLMLTQKTTTDDPNNYVHQILETITAYSTHNFSSKIPIGNDNTILDAFVMGINTLGEELERSVVSKDFLDSMLSSLTDVIWSSSTDLENIIYVNHAFNELFGIDRELFYKNPKIWLDVIYHEDRNKFKKEFKKLFTAGQFDCSYRIVKGDDQLHWIQSRGVLIHDSQNKPERIDILSFDITKIKETEDLLSQAEGISLIGNWKYDLVTGDLSFSEGVYKLFEQEIIPKQIASRKFMQLIHPDDRRKLKELLNVTDLNVTTSSCVFRVLLSESRMKHIKCTVQYNRNIKREIHKINGVVQDITEQMMNEEIRIKNIDLQKAKEIAEYRSNMKDEFLANMSHELRTPLNAISLNLQLLFRQKKGPLNESQTRYLQSIDKSSQHLLGLINDILDLSKIQANKAELNRETLSVIDCCYEVVELVKQQASNKEIKLQIELDPELKYIVADSRRVKQILINLLSNAIKFTPSGGSIGLRTKFDDINKLAEFHVWDTGIGISENNRAKLFQPFMQLDGSLNRNFEGTGLGLALSRRLAELHKGTITFNSKVGEGTTFTFALPIGNLTADALAKLEKNNSQLEEPMGNFSGSTLILIAEDNEMNLETILDFFKETDFKILEARNGKEAVNIAVQHNPDVILMDIQMPEMNGLEAIKEIRKSAYTANTPIIALTALAMQGDKEKCLEAGANDYISKPFSFTDLLNKINMLINR